MAPGIYTAKDGRTGRVSRTSAGSYLIKWNDGTTTLIGEQA